MTDWIVRLSSLQIRNMKNVEYGKIIMPKNYNKDMSYKGAEVLGIYGQNGSGKTTIVDSMYFLQKILLGESLSDELCDYIRVGEKNAELVADFIMFAENIVYEVCYSIGLQKKQNEVEIIRESLSCAKNYEGKRTNKTVFMEFNREDSKTVFSPKVRYDEFIALDRENKTDLLVAKKIAEKSNCSYIFGETSRELFLCDFKKGIWEYAKIINALVGFGLKDLFVIRNEHSGCISANDILPMAFKIADKQGGIKGDFVLPITEPIVIPKEHMELLETIVEQINIVLRTIIPGMEIEIKNYGEQLCDDGELGYKSELLSVKKDTLPIPIRMESEGIIKIISILNALIQAYASPSVCLIIDELDAGIFEYMLGELLDVFNKSAKGQLVFTSHNLRALEMLNKENIMFSTANFKNRYIHLKNYRDGLNNMRDFYLRGITLGGQDEIIYEETDSLKMARAFRKAGRIINNG